MCMCTCNRDRVCVVNHRQILIGASMHGGCFSFHSQAWSVAKCCNLCQSQARCHSQVHSASAAICTSTISLPQQALITVTGNMVGQGSDLAHVWLQILISYSETGHLTQSVLPWQLQFSLLSSAYFLCPQPSSYLQLCCSLQILKRCKTQWLHFLLFYFNIHWLPIPQRIQYKKDTLCYKCIMRTALSLAPIHGMTWWHSPSSLTKTLPGLLQIKLKAFLFPKQQTCNVFRAALLSSSAPSLFVVCWTCVEIKFCIVNIFMRAGACVCGTHSHHMR